MPMRPVTLTAFAQPSWLRLVFSLLSSPPHATTLPQPPCRLPALPRGLASKMQLTRTVMCMHSALMCNACVQRTHGCTAPAGKREIGGNHTETLRESFAAMSSPGASAPAGEKACAGATQPSSTAAKGSMLLVKPMPATCTTTAHRTPSVSLDAAAATVHHRPARTAQRTHRARGPARRCWSGGERRRSAALRRTSWLRTGRRSRAARPAPPACPSRCPAPLSHTEAPSTSRRSERPPNWVGLFQGSFRCLSFLKGIFENIFTFMALFCAGLKNARQL